MLNRNWANVFFFFYVMLNVAKEVKHTSACYVEI